MKALCIVVVGVLLASSASGHQPLWPTDTPNGDVDIRDHDFPFTGYPDDIVATGDIVAMGDGLFPFADEQQRKRKRLTKEHLPLVHDCPEARATIYHQHMVESELTTACEVLQETADRFHAVTRTNRTFPYGVGEVDVLLFSSWENMNEFWQDFIGRKADFGGRYVGPRPDSYMIQSFEREGYRSPGDSWQRRTEGSIWRTLRHEYTHFLDTSHQLWWWCVHHEGLAEYLAFGNEYANFLWQAYIGDGSNLPSLLDTWYNRDTSGWLYSWGYKAVRFLFEEHPQIIRRMYARGCDGWQNLPENRWNAYANEALPPLNDDWHRWLREFTAFVELRQIEPITLFLRRKDDGSPIGWRDAYDMHWAWADGLWYNYSEPLEYDYAGLAEMRLSRYIQTSQDIVFRFRARALADDKLTVEVSLSDETGEIVSASSLIPSFFPT